MNDNYEDSIVTRYYIDENGIRNMKGVIEEQQVSPGKNIIQLTETPDVRNGVTIVNRSNMVQVEDIGDVGENENYYFVSTDGLVYFHPNLSGKTIKLKYKSVGVTLLSSNRVFYKDKSDTPKILEDLISKGYDASSEYEGLKAIMIDENNAVNLQNQVNKTNSQLEQKANDKDVRKKTIAITEYDISDTLKQQINGNAPILQTVGDGIVTPLKTTFIKPKKNLINLDALIPNSYVEFSTGKIISGNTSYYASDYMMVKEGLSYRVNGSAVAIQHSAFYNSNKEYVGAMPGFTNPFTVPSGALYIRVSVMSSYATNKNEVYIVEGTVPMNPVEPYKEVFDNNYLELSENSIPELSGKKIMNGSISEDKISFTASENILDYNAVTRNMYVEFVSGVLRASTSYISSDYMDIEPSTIYTRNLEVHELHFAYYDENKVFIPSAVNNLPVTFTTPSNARYLRVSINILTNSERHSLAGIKKGTVYGVHKLYKRIIKNNYVNLINSIGSEEIKAEAVSIKHLAFTKKSNNLFDINSVTMGKYVQYTTGSLLDNPIYCVSDYIKVEPNSVVTVTSNRMLAFYDADYKYISGIDNGTVPLTFTTPINSHYFRISIPTEKIDNFMINLGEKLLDYESYERKIGKEYIETVGDVSNDTFLLFLPSEICIAVGRTIELYNSQVCWCGNINNYHFKWVSNVGKSMKRKWSFKGVEEKIGEYPLTCYVYDNNMKEVARKSTTIKVVKNNLTIEKSILPIGDSLTNNKAWIREVRTLSGDKIKYVGTRWNGDVKGGNYNHEGRSGATAGWYLGNNTYDFESSGVTASNPFYNPTTSKFDFNYYKSTYSINPDIIQLFLGTNGIALDPTTNVNNIKAIVNGIREADETIPIYVVFTLYRGDQNGMGNQLSSDGYSAGSGVWKLEEDRKVYNLMVALNEALKDYTNLYFVPVSLTHDSEYNFQSSTATIVNPRSSITEYVHSEATHPSASSTGYLQMADIMFSTFIGHMN